MTTRISNPTLSQTTAQFDDRRGRSLSFRRSTGTPSAFLRNGKWYPEGTSP